MPTLAIRGLETFRMPISRDTEPWVQLATRIPKTLHRRVKLHCVLSDISLMDFVVVAIQERLEREAGRKRKPATST